MSNRLNESQTCVKVVRCGGDLNATEMVRMKSRFRRLMSQKRRFFLMDLSEAQHADLAALGILIDRIRQVRSAKGDIRLFNIRPEVFKVLQMIGLTGVIETFQDEQEARQSFQIA